MEKEYKPMERFNQNDFSFWFPKIESCGIKVPKSVVIPVPADIIRHYYMDNCVTNMAEIRKFVNTEVEPKIAASGITAPYFVKNGTFSNKFEAATSCLPNADFDLATAIANINYASEMAGIIGAGGMGEVVIREKICHNPKVTPCIYNGLPFRSEFRVFYDFDDRKVLFSVNYWDYDYIRRNPRDRLYDMTDKIIFDHESDKLARVFEERKADVEQLVAEHMANIEGLENAWSIDLLLDEWGTFWLIDMAVAEMSAFWEWRNGKILKVDDSTELETLAASIITKKVEVPEEGEFPELVLLKEIPLTEGEC